MYSKLASAIYNHLVTGLRGYHQNPTISIEQIEDEIVETRLQIIKEYLAKNLLPREELLTTINCVTVDCQDLERCCSVKSENGTPVAHFEIPQLVHDFGTGSIAYVGSPDRQNPFIVYINSNFKNTLQKYRRRGKDKPYVMIDPAPNADGFCDCYIFNAPYIKKVSVVGLFKDLRQLEELTCCVDSSEISTGLDAEIKDRMIKKLMSYYRAYPTQTKPNTQEYT